MSDRTELRRLPSGLTLVTRTLPEAPVASVHLWFDAGAVDEAPEEAGMAHFVEHALFKGTATREVGRAAAEIEGLGGDLNAWTSWDETCFHATLDARAVPEALDVLLDMTSSSTMDPDELLRETEVVIDEIRGYEDDPDSVAADAAQRVLFGQHPYGRPIIGYEKTVRGFRAPAATAFWRRHYHPGRATLAVVGPVDAEAVESLITPALRRWPVGMARAPIPSVPSPLAGAVDKVRGDFDTVVVHVTWPGPNNGHPDLPALDVAQMALFGGAGSRAVGALDLDRGVASQIRPISHPMLGAGVVGVAFQCGETEEALRLLFAILVDSLTQGLPRSEVVRAREGLLGDLLFGQETAEGKAAELVHWTARTGDPRGDLTYRAAVAAVGPEDVNRVSRAWLRPELAQVVVVDKKARPKRLRDAFAPRLRPPVPRRGVAGPQVVEVAGVPVHVLPDQGEIVAVYVTATGGLLAERPSTAGTTDAWSRMATRGAGPWDPRTLGERNDVTGVDLGAGGDRSQLAIDLSCPADEVVAAFEVLGRTIADPYLDEHDWDNVREEMLDDLHAWRDRPGQAAYDRLWEALFPNHPWRLPAEGTAASVQRITTAHLRRFHQGAFARSNLVVGVAGRIDPDRVAELLEPALRELPAKGRVPEPPEPGPVRAPRVVRAGTSQAHLLVGVRGVAADHPDRATLAVACSVLDSQSGRLFLALRERRGLAYGVWARSDVAHGGGLFSAGLATDPERLDEAREALLHELRRMIDPGPGPEEVDRVKRMLRGLAAMRLERVGARASDLAWCARFGQTFGLEALDARLAQVTPERVREVLGRLLVDPVVVSVLPGRS